MNKKKNILLSLTIILIFLISLNKLRNNQSFKMVYTKIELSNYLDEYMKNDHFFIEIFGVHDSENVIGAIHNTSENGDLFLTDKLFIYNIGTDFIQFYDNSENTRIVDFYCKDGLLYKITIEYSEESFLWKLIVSDSEREKTKVLKKGYIKDALEYPTFRVYKSRLYFSSLEEISNSESEIVSKKYMLSEVSNKGIEELLTYIGNVNSNDGILVYNDSEFEFFDDCFYHTIVDEKSIQHLMCYSITDDKNYEIKKNVYQDYILYSFVPTESGIYIQFVNKNLKDISFFEFLNDKVSFTNYTQMNTFERKINQSSILFHNKNDRWKIYDFNNDKIYDLTPNDISLMPKYFVIGENRFLVQSMQKEFYLIELR